MVVVRLKWARTRKKCLAQRLTQKCSLPDAGTRGSPASLTRCAQLSALPRALCYSRPWAHRKASRVAGRRPLPTWAAHPRPVPSGARAPPEEVGGNHRLGPWQRRRATEDNTKRRRFLLPLASKDSLEGPSWAAAGSVSTEVETPPVFTQREGSESWPASRGRD